MNRNTVPRNFKDASIIALWGLAYIIQDETLRDRFLALTGLPAEQLKEQAEDTGFLIGVLDFLMGNEADLLSFSARYDLSETAASDALRILRGDRLLPQ